MTIKRRIEITVETQQVTVTRDEAPLSAWCIGCQNHVLMIGLEQAALLAGNRWYELDQQTDAPALHYYEPRQQDGQLWICLASLSQWLLRATQAMALLSLLAFEIERTT